MKTRTLFLVFFIKVNTHCYEENSLHLVTASLKFGNYSSNSKSFFLIEIKNLNIFAKKNSNMKRNSILILAVITLSLFVACQQTTKENDSVSTDSQTLEVSETQEETTSTSTETVSESIEKNTETVFTVVEESAMFPGGQEELIKYLALNIKYPKQAKVRGVEGLVYVSFVVEKDGSLTDINLLKDIGSGCGQEAVRVVKEMPKWRPAKLKGEKVRMQFNLPVKFTLAN